MRWFHFDRALLSVWPNWKFCMFTKSFQGFPPHWELNLWGDCLSASSSFGSGVRERVNRRLPDVFLQQCGSCSGLLWWVSHSVYVPTLTYSHELWGVPVNSSRNELPTTQTQPINSRGRMNGLPIFSHKVWVSTLFVLNENNNYYHYYYYCYSCSVLKDKINCRRKVTQLWTSESPKAMW